MTQRQRTRAEISFHIGLMAVVVPLGAASMLRSDVALPFAAKAFGIAMLAFEVIGLFALAIVNARLARDDAQQRRWTRRLFVLAAVDALVAVSLVFGSVSAVGATTVGPPPARIGVMLEEEHESVVVREVYAGSPADRAGVRAGDRIVLVGSDRIRRASDLAAHVGHGHEVVLTVERGGQRTALRVTPSAHLPPPTVVHTNTRCEAPVDASPPSPWDFTPYALFLVLASVLWILGRRRARQWTFWIPFAGVLVAGAVASDLGAWIGCLLAGGIGLRARTAGLFLGEVAVALMAIVWLLLVRKRQKLFADERDRWPIARTYATGLLYAVAWMPRVAAASIVLLWASQKLGVGEVSPVLEEVLGHSGMDPVTAILTFGAAAILAPVAEETLFRGLLLPHLVRSFTPWMCIYVGAVLFGMLHVAHGVMLIGPLLLGAVLGWARMRSRGLVAPILLHVTFNATAILMSWRLQ